METEGLRKRPVEAAKSSAPAPTKSEAGTKKHGGAMQALRMAGLVSYFWFSILCIHFQQFLGFPLYLYNKDWYYAWQALAKQYFGLLLVTMQEWWSPIEIRVSGDKSVAGQIEQTPDGKVKLKFPERLVQFANHQLYTDWVYCWWASYTANRHGHLFIILKASLRWIPFIGPGMMIFSFIFLSRHWETDKARFQHRLKKLKTTHGGPLSGSSGLDPMWLLIFPEGTTLCANGRKASASWAEKKGIPDLKNTLLPRSRGLQFCLEELEGSVDWVYDCTIGYDGIPPGEYGQDVFTLPDIYLNGGGPSAIHMHWRRFPVSSIPVKDADAFDTWLRDRWTEKDEILAYYKKNGSFPADPEAVVVASSESANGTTKAPHTGVVVTKVSPSHPLEFLQIFVSIIAMPFVWKLFKWVFWFLSFFIRFR